MKAFLVWVLSGKSASKLTLLQQTLLSVSLSAIVVWIFPQTAMAQSTQTLTTPTLAFEIKDQNPTDWQHLIVAGASSKTTDQPADKAEILRQYLASKDSPLAGYVDVLLMQPNWKNIVSISNAESTLCKHQLGNNCWGIGGAEYFRYYPTFAAGIVDANNLIQKYHDGGLTTPAAMMHRWVGWNNHQWVAANNQVLSQLDTLGI